MAIGRIVHYIGVLFVVVAFVLLLVTCIGAPAVHHLGMLDIHLKNASTAVFGPFGYCVQHVASGGDICSKASVGYIPAQEMRLLDPATTWTTWKGHDLDLMTVAYVLFPIACAIVFFAAAFAFCGVVGSLVASVLCATAFLIVFIIMIVAFVSFGYLKSHVQDHGLKSNYGSGMWTAVAAFVLLLFAMFMLFTSCLSQRKKHRNKHVSNEKGFRHREDSEKSLNRHDNHHLGRDAALGTTGVGGYEADRHHRNHNTVNGDTSRDQHHIGRDAALGTAGVGAYEAGKHHRNQNNIGTDGSRDHHYGRDAALGGAGVAAYEAGHHDQDHSGRRHAPANAAAARAMEGVGQSRNEQSSGLANQDRQSQGLGQVGHNSAALDAAGRQTGTVTHYHPTVTTSTATYVDERGVLVEGPHTESYDPMSGERRQYRTDRAL